MSLIQGGEEYLTEEQVAQVLGIAKLTLRKNRSLKKNHPPFIRVGRLILFPKDECEKWLKSFPLETESSDKT